MGLGRARSSERNFMKKLIKTLSSKKVFAIDPATHSVAFACVEFDGTQFFLLGCGKIDLRGCDTSEKFSRLNAVMPILIKHFDCQLAYIEQPIYIQNFQTSRMLSYVVGYTWGRMTQENVRVIDIGPMQWKSGIGYSRVSAAEKQEWAKTMTTTEVKKKTDFERKNRVKNILAGVFDLSNIDDNDIVDAIGIAYWASNQKGENNGTV